MSCAAAKPINEKYPSWKGSMADNLLMALKNGTKDVMNPFEPASLPEEPAIFSDFGFNKHTPAAAKTEATEETGSEEDSLKVKIEKRREQNREAQRRFRQRARAEANRVPEGGYLGDQLAPANSNTTNSFMPNMYMPAGHCQTEDFTNKLMGGQESPNLGKRFRDGPAAMAQKPMAMPDMKAAPPTVDLKQLLGHLANKPVQPLDMPMQAHQPSPAAPAAQAPPSHLFQLLQMQVQNKSPVEMQQPAQQSFFPSNTSNTEASNPSPTFTHTSFDDQRSTDCSDSSRQESASLQSGEQEETPDSKRNRRRVQNREAQRRHRARAKQAAISVARNNAAQMAPTFSSAPSTNIQMQPQVDLRAQLINVLASNLANKPVDQQQQQASQPMPQHQQQMAPQNLQQILQAVGMQQPPAQHQQQFNVGPMGGIHNMNPFPMQPVRH